MNQTSLDEIDVLLHQLASTAQQYSHMARNWVGATLGIAQNWRYWGCSLAMGSQLIASSPEYVSAQITPDGTLPNNSIVTPNGSTLNITGGTQAGSNLFHSFGEFSVPTGGIASFNNGVDIQNIISRVTGGSASKIDGIISTKGAANLFLINPNGIIFGQDAQLNIGGSFVGTTANALQFGDRGFFSATEKNIPSPLLTINPSALLFNQINQNAAIQNNSVAPLGTDPAGLNVFGLQVPDGKSLLLVGGNVSMDGGRLNAFDGRVELGGLAEAGSVALGVDDDNLSLRFPDNVARTSVSLNNRSGIYVEGAGDGNIAVNARNLKILGGSTLSGGIGQGLGTPETVAGDITLNATGEIKVAGTGSSVRNRVNLGSLGNAGNITIDSGSFSLSNGARLTAETGGQGNAGDVTVSAKDVVSLADADILSTVEDGGVGKGGNIDINATTLLLTDGAQLVTSTREASETTPAGRGDAGNVNVNVTGAVDIVGENSNSRSGIRSRVETGAVGNAGNITIYSGSFSLRERGVLTAETGGQGNAGDVTVSAKDVVSLADADILSTVEEGGVGKGGNIDINATTLLLTDGAQLVTSTREASETTPAGLEDTGNVTVSAKDAVSIAGADSGIRTLLETEAVGNAGNITIDSGSFYLSDGARLTAETRGQGNAGDVTVRAKNAVSLDNAFILSTVEDGGVGKGGNIDINATTLLLTDGAQLVTSTREASETTPAGRGDAGNVNVNVTGAVDIVGENSNSRSGIRSRVETGAVGNAGNITIYSGSFSLRERGVLTAETGGQGNAGDVTVSAKDVVSLADADILSTVEEGGVGKGGNIDINATTLLLTDGAQLVTSTREASETTPAGLEDTGNVTVSAKDAVSIAGADSGIRTLLETEAVGNAGNITIDSGSFYLSDGARLTAETRGQGNAGDVTVRAKNAVSLDNAFILSTVEDGGVGKGGNIDINATALSLTDGAQLVTSTREASETTPAGRGDAGDVNVNVTGAVDIVGENSNSRSGIRSRVETGAVGNAGNITIYSGSFSLNDAQLVASTFGQGNAGTIKVNIADFFSISANSPNFNSGLFVNSLSETGTAGNIVVTSPRVTLDNGGTLNAQSESGNGGDINIQTDLLLLRRNARITTTAGRADAGGNGGNINIDVPSGFIIAVPSENSDIIANAFIGTGGRVDIKAFGIYGIQFRESQTSLSDITASSRFGTQGTVELNTPGIDPNSSLVELPTIPVDTQVAQGCYSPGYAQNRFVITGRGGLPFNPKDILTPDASQTDWVSFKPSNNNSPIQPITGKPTISAPKRIVEATGVTLNAKGEIVLTANSSNATPNTFKQNSTQCYGS